MRKTAAVIMLWLLCAGGSVASGTEISPAPEPALVIIDIQNFYFESGLLPLAGSVEASLKAKTVLEKFRAKGLPVIHIRHESKKAVEEGRTNDPQHAIHPNEAPIAGEKVITKHYANSFRETELIEYLREKQIHRLVLCGMQTHMCLEATARAEVRGS
ncbi:MAG: isochorismatase family protein [Acidobacteriota bacterium]